MKLRLRSLVTKESFTYFFWNLTPSFSRRAQASSMFSTENAMWPKPLGSLFPLW